ncbi:uncharacterized protein LOC133186545 [Saccostrea echinata]|uniref:uncharacterized protein LOC133186545 n=1 Tax=Saccostrea echinata TaxID=191078 RepID=UPI002A80A311|nr:uncharacterized protein LOC133186545 [Saccostrea echinata]
MECGWSFWSDWTPCSYPCEGKTKWRKRHCLTQFCNGVYYEYEYCEPKDCLLETKPPPVAFRHNINNSYIPQETNRYFKSSGIVRETMQMTTPITHLVPTLTDLLKKITRQKEKNTATFVKKSEIDIDDHETNVQMKIREVTKLASQPAHGNMNAKQNDQPTSKEEGKERNVNVVILVAVPILTVCGVSYTIARIYKIIKDKKANSKEATENTRGQWPSLSSNKISSTEENREVQEYNYVSYDEISKRGSYENSSPSHSYVYDVTWN